MITGNSPNSFGYWTSPSVDPNPDEKRSIVVPPVYKGTFTVNSDQTDASLAPIVSVRTNYENFEQGAVLVATSVDDGSFSPTTSARTYELYFTTPVSTEVFTSSFDFLNFDTGDAVNSSIALDTVTFTEVSLSEQDTIVTQDFSTGSLGWTPRDAAPALEVPPTAVTSLGLEIGGASEENERRGIPISNPYGYWGSPEGDEVLTLTGGQFYDVSFTVTTNAADTDRANIPALRFRVNSADLKLSTYVIIESVNDTVRMPTAGESETYSLFFVAPAEMDGVEALFSFDYLVAPNSGNDPSIAATLQTLNVSTWDIE